MTESAKQALSLLRDISNFQWYIIPIFIIVIYVYAVEIEKKNWNVFFAGLAFWGMEQTLFCCNQFNIICYS